MSAFRTSSWEMLLDSKTALVLRRIPVQLHWCQSSGSINAALSAMRQHLIPNLHIFTTVSCQELFVILDTTLPFVDLNVWTDVGRWRPLLLPTIWTWQNSAARLCKESELVLSFYISRSAARWERPWGVCLLLWDVTSCNVALDKVWRISSNFQTRLWSTQTMCMYDIKPLRCLLYIVLDSL